MNYCKFRNTLKDLQHCEEDIDLEADSEEEENARKKLISLCKEIAETYE